MQSLRFGLYGFVGSDCESRLVVLQSSSNDLDLSASVEKESAESGSVTLRLEAGGSRNITISDIVTPRTLGSDRLGLPDRLRPMEQCIEQAFRKPSRRLINRRLASHSEVSSLIDIL